MTDDLEKRITAALSSEDMLASELEALVIETENGIVQAKETAAFERDRALDPTISPNPTAARAAMEDALFRVGRLETILPRLQTHFAKRQKREQLEQWRKRYEGLELVRDVLVDEMREIYPSLVAQLADLMQRVGAFDRAASDLHGDRAAGVKLHLDSPELIARGIERFDREHPPLSANLQLPEFESGNRLVFPPPRERAVPLALPYDPQFSPQWHEAARERAWARIEEAKRVADYYQKPAKRGERAS